MLSFEKYNLKTGIIISTVFPLLFIFDRAGNSIGNILLQFVTFFLFILISWIYNYHTVNFGILIQTNSYFKWSSTYSNAFLSIVLSIALYFLLAVLFNTSNILFESLFKNNFSLKSWFYIILRISLFDIGLLLTQYFIENNKEKKRVLIENESLKAEQAKATLETFKQQVDPHFLFNSLNTLQSLIKKESIIQSIQFVSELSQVYRYMLQRRDKNYVTLKEEIEFLKSYVYLLEIRFGNAFRMSIAIQTDVLNSLIPIHTLQLLTENAVKHNNVTTIDPLFIEIINQDKYILIKNKLSPKIQYSYNSGIGLENINIRYKLMFGSEIEIVQSDGFFIVKLPIIT